MKPRRPTFRSLSFIALASFAAVASFALFAGPAQAQSWTARRLVLPRGGTSLDLGFALDVLPRGDAPHRPIGTGLNLEVAHGIANDLELGLRFGFRFDHEGRWAKTDHRARLYDNETYEDAGTVLADPELRLRWGLVRGSVLELGFEGRVVFPFAGHFVAMPAVPLRLHLGAVRIDSGVYIPIIFANETTTVVSIPLQLWIQASSSLWLGPIFGLRAHEHHRAYPVGFGIGTYVSQRADLRFQFLIPDVESRPATISFGLALGFRL